MRYSGGSIDIKTGVNLRVSKVQKYVENCNLRDKEINFVGKFIIGRQHNEQEVEEGWQERGGSFWIPVEI